MLREAGLISLADRVLIQIIDWSSCSPCERLACLGPVLEVLWDCKTVCALTLVAWA